ncbi:MAG: hypothetical protein IJ551_11015 [Prevotella sp.]|nr:hypothetical protein [Prevotella sp.]
MYKTICIALLGLMTVVACSTDDDEPKLLYTDGSSMSTAAWNGEYAVNWVVDGEVVDTTRLQVMVQTNVLSMPYGWLQQQAFPTAREVTTWDTESLGWDMHFYVTGYSENNYYFTMMNTQFEHRAMVDERLLTYDVFFSPTKSTAVYNPQWDSWTAAMFIDSIQIMDEKIRENHRPVVLETRRFTPALLLTMQSTKRTR